jgi:hypothetical protein
VLSRGSNAVAAVVVIVHFVNLVKRRLDRNSERRLQAQHGVMIGVNWTRLRLAAFAQVVVGAFWHHALVPDATNGFVTSVTNDMGVRYVGRNLFRGDIVARLVELDKRVSGMGRAERLGAIGAAVPIFTACALVPHPDDVLRAEVACGRMAACLRGGPSRFGATKLDTVLQSAVKHGLESVGWRMQFLSVEKRETGPTKVIITTLVALYVSHGQRRGSGR